MSKKIKISQNEPPTDPNELATPYEDLDNDSDEILSAWKAKGGIIIQVRPEIFCDDSPESAVIQWAIIIADIFRYVADTLPIAPKDGVLGAMLDVLLKELSEPTADFTHLTKNQTKN